MLSKRQFPLDSVGNKLTEKLTEIDYRCVLIQFKWADFWN